MSATIEDRSSIVDSVVFVRLGFGVFGNSKQIDDSVFDTDADKTMLKAQKELLDSPQLKAINKADNRIRMFLKARCLPYDAGYMLLPYGLADETEPILDEYQKVTRPGLVQEFITAYPSLCKDATERLQSQYNPTDYPSIEAIQGKFYFNYQYLSFSVPDSAKFKGLAKKAEEQFKAKLETASQEITILMRQTLLDLVDHLKGALEPNADGKPKRLFASNITNVQEFLNTFKARNITNDSDLEKVVGDLQALVHPGFSVDVLKEDATFKEDFHAKISGITSQLSTLVETVPGRKFKTVE